MKVVELLEIRRENWRELERLCDTVERRRRAPGSEGIVRFAALYRAACADLALADAYQLPPNTVRYLHQLVGRAHNQLYRSRTFDVRAWGKTMLVDVPQQMFRDRFLRLAFCLFWGLFVATALVAYRSDRFTDQLIGKAQREQLEEMYSSSPSDDRSLNASGMMSGYYVNHNVSIGLQCFAAGLIFGVGGLFATVSNAAQLGAMFGHMARLEPQRSHFFHFVTAHGPCELTAIVLSAAAGMRMGFALVDTGGWTRAAALRRAGRKALPTMCAAVVLFLMAAMIEAYVSPSILPYWVKALVAGFTSAMLIFYFVMLGYPRDELDATG